MLLAGHCCTAVHWKEGIKWRGHTIRKQHYIIIFIFLQRMGFSLVNCAMCLRAPIPDVVVLSHCEAIILRFCFAMLRIHFPTHLMRLSVDNVDKYWLIWNLACCIVCLVRFQFPTRTIDDTNYHCKYLTSGWTSKRNGQRQFSFFVCVTHRSISMWEALRKQSLLQLKRREIVCYWKVSI